MTAREDAPDVDQLARSMVLLHGGHDDDDHPVSENGGGSWSKAPDFASDPDRAAAVQAATLRDRERYLSSGLTPVDCRFCHATVAVKKLGSGIHSGAVELRRRHSAAPTSLRSAPTAAAAVRARSCPRRGDSIKHAVAEGCLEAVSSAPSPGRRLDISTPNVRFRRESPNRSDHFVLLGVARHSPAKRSLTCSAVSP